MKKTCVDPESKEEHKKNIKAKINSLILISTVIGLILFTLTLVLATFGVVFELSSLFNFFTNVEVSTAEQYYLGISPSIIIFLLFCQSIFGIITCYSLANNFTKKNFQKGIILVTLAIISLAISVLILIINVIVFYYFSPITNHAIEASIFGIVFQICVLPFLIYLIILFSVAIDNLNDSGIHLI